jgi:flagellar biosynthesis protein FliQ
MKFVISAQNLFFLPKIVKTFMVINNYAKGFGRELGLLP